MTILFFKLVNKLKEGSSIASIVQQDFFTKKLTAASFNSALCMMLLRSKVIYVSHEMLNWKGSGHYLL